MSEMLLDLFSSSYEPEMGRGFHTVRSGCPEGMWIGLITEDLAGGLCLALDSFFLDCAA